MNDIRNTLKSKSELTPFLMVLFFMLCSLCTSFDFYFYGYEIMQDICEVSLLFCIFMYAHSEKWSFVAKRSLLTLILLNVLNLLHHVYEFNGYYLYYQALIYAFFITMIIYEKCKQQ